MMTFRATAWTHHLPGRPCVLSTDQRRVAYAIVSLTCVAWSALGVAGIVTSYATPTGRDGTGGFLFLLAVVGVILVVASLAALAGGLLTVRRVHAGAWRWYGVLLPIGFASAVSVWVGVLLIPSSPTLGTLVVLQAALLLGLGAVLRPSPTAPH
jgi:hypothetical protein